LIDDELGRGLGKFRSRVPREQLQEASRRQIAGLLWHTLCTPLSALGCRLCDVAAEDRLHEVEFHFPEREPGPLPAEVRRQEGFLTGFMDLVLRHDGRLFLVDWKTNWLAGYGAGDVARSVVDCDYVRQYRLYLQALARWLTRVHGKAFNFEREFGGVYYLYMRGMNASDESSGVYFCRPTATDLRLDLVLND
jgi:exodeoxyribonuclease V beta subunit